MNSRAPEIPLRQYSMAGKDNRTMKNKQAGYTHCPSCGIDSMDGDLCAYCEEDQERKDYGPDADYEGMILDQQDNSYL